MNDKNGNFGCFMLLIAIACGFFLLVYLLRQCCQSIQEEYKDNPKDVIVGVIVVGIIAFFLFKTSIDNKK